MATVMVLAAGYGSRLRPLTEERPKALVPVGDVPAIAHLIRQLRAQLGNSRILANAHHQSGELVSFLSSYDPTLIVLVEPEILGTAGGLRGALDHLDEGPLLVVNTDVISKPNYREILQFVTDDGIVLGIQRKPAGQGPLGIGAQGRVVRLRGERVGTEISGGDYLGVAALGRQVASQLPLRGCLVGDFLLPLLRAGACIETVEVQGEWFDIGTLHNYAKANRAWLLERNLEAWVGPSCAVPVGIQLKETLLGQGTRLSGSGLIQRVIAWPSADVRAPLRDAVVTSTGRIVPISEGPS